MKDLCHLLPAILAVVFSLVLATLAADDLVTATCRDSVACADVDTGRYPTWEDAPTSAEEFDHDNPEEMCRLPIISLRKWEAGKFWRYDQPFLVTNVTDDWPAMHNFAKQEFLRRYPDIVVGMGSSRELGQTGPDDAGDALKKTTIEDYVLNVMHDPRQDKYVFDRKLNIPDGLVEDCQPYPHPLRWFREDPLGVLGSNLAPNKLWKDHLALTIGRDQQGLTFHRHNAALNIVLFGRKRWILYDQIRFAENRTRLKRMTRDINKPIQLTTPEWIRQLYGKDERMEEIRKHGHDCVQGPGDMLYVPRGWAHMVLNIGDTVAVVSERGLDNSI